MNRTAKHAVMALHALLQERVPHVFHRNCNASRLPRTGIQNEIRRQLSTVDPTLLHQVLANRINALKALKVK